MARKNQAVNMRSTLLGMFVNLLLFATKFGVGSLIGSRAVVADAMNNLSDGLTSLVGFVGFKVAAKPADEEHPYGHQRFEYISGFLISIIMIYVGIDTFREAFASLGHQGDLTTFPFLLGILGATTLAKLGLWYFYKQAAKQTKSDVLLANAQDSLNDVLITSSVIVSVIIYTIWHIRIDAFLAMAIALLIIYSGVQTIRNFINKLIGFRPSNKTLNAIKQIIDENPQVLECHDLMIHYYGSEQVYGSVHVEVDGSLGLFEAHDIIDDIEKNILAQTGILISVHLDPIDLKSQHMKHIHQIIKRTIRSYDNSLRFHDLRMMDGIIHFDIVAKPDINQHALKLLIAQELVDKGYAYQLHITYDNIQL